MDAEWIKSPTGRRIILHWADSRPAWLWSADGATLLWRNAAARFFNCKVKKDEIRLSPDAIPIKGQISRLIRLGMPGHTSLSRIQFLAGRKPVSATCACTPLKTDTDQMTLLIVGVDPVDGAVVDFSTSFDSLREELLPEHAEHIVFSQTGDLLGGSASAVEALADSAVFDPARLTAGATVTFDGMPHAVTRFEASPAGAALYLLEPIEPAPAEPDIIEVPASAEIPEADQLSILKADLVPRPSTPEREAEALESEKPGRLSSLFDQLANDATLYEPLPEPAPIVGIEQPASPESADIEAGEDETDGVEDAGVDADMSPATGVQDPARRMLVRLVGRGFEPLTDLRPDIAEPKEQETESPAAEEFEPQEPEAETSEPIEPRGDAVSEAEKVDRVSRYNFDELSRILNDRVSGDAGAHTARTTDEEIVAPDAMAAVPGQSGVSSLVNLSGETLVLNRLPLGILVFTDQQVLFANRAITAMVGYESVDALRQAGLAAVFPGMGDSEQQAGPVNHLVQRDGTLVPVTARLQSISWQGRPALMLSASTTEVRTGHEAAVRAFAESLAQTRGEGFIEANRSGVITLISAQARGNVDQGDFDFVGRALTTIIVPSDASVLREFLERPARFAETARPFIVLRGLKDTEILLFAQGQAGIVTGYFGFVRRPRSSVAARPLAQERGTDPALLSRITRGLRGPLNSIIGFSDLIRTGASETGAGDRAIEYAQDISTAGHEIAALVDELDDYARLQAGHYAALPVDVDLDALLASCVQRVRGQANGGRVLVRSAISERLPPIRADRASLGQAILNLLASAIDQTPPGESVVLSAQFEDDGRIAIQVRDNAPSALDMAERFVVFRDGVGKDGEALAPIRSSVGLALTRALLAVNRCVLTVNPAGGSGTLFSLVLPADLVALPPPDPVATPD